MRIFLPRNCSSDLEGGCQDSEHRDRRRVQCLVSFLRHFIGWSSHVRWQHWVRCIEAVSSLVPRYIVFVDIEFMMIIFLLSIVRSYDFYWIKESWLFGIYSSWDSKYWTSRCILQKIRFAAKCDIVLDSSLYFLCIILWFPILMEGFGEQFKSGHLFLIYKGLFHLKWLIIDCR